jgi:hypothetical protein
MPYPSDVRQFLLDDQSQVTTCQKQTHFLEFKYIIKQGKMITLPYPSDNRHIICNAAPVQYKAREISRMPYLSDIRHFFLGHHSQVTTCRPQTHFLQIKFSIKQGKMIRKPYPSDIRHFLLEDHSQVTTCRHPTHFLQREDEYPAIPLRRPTLFAGRSVTGQNMPTIDTFSGMQVQYKAREDEYQAIPIRRPTL